MKYTLRAVKVARNGTIEVEDDEMVLNSFYHPQTGESMIAILIPEVPVEVKEKKAEEEEEKKAEEDKE